MDVCARVCIGLHRLIKKQKNKGHARAIKTKGTEGPIEAVKQKQE